MIQSAQLFGHYLSVLEEVQRIVLMGKAMHQKDFADC